MNATNEDRLVTIIAESAVLIYGSILVLSACVMVAAKIEHVSMYGGIVLALWGFGSTGYVLKKWKAAKKQSDAHA